MTTAQALPNGHPSFPPPVSVENPADLHPADLPANQDHISQNQSAANHQTPPSAQEKVPVGAYHVPPSIYVPTAHAYRRDDHLDTPHLDSPLPRRCQFTFSDGRQCTMARSDIHPSLCRYHSEREDQLFGEPGSHVFGAALDLPELYSACRDLTTAAGVSRALAQVFRLLAQRRISQREAATFGQLAKLLLRTISLMAAESFAARAAAAEPLIPSESAPEDESKALSFPLPANANLSNPPIAASSEPMSPPAGIRNSPNPPKINRSPFSVCNSPEISRYQNAGLHPIQNQHLHDNGGRIAERNRSCAESRRPVQVNVAQVART